MWFSVVCTLIYSDIRDNSGQNLRRVRPQHFEHCDEAIFVDKSPYNAKPHSIC